MSVLVINDGTRAEIRAAIERAQKSPLPLQRLREGAIEGRRGVVTLADRKPGFERPTTEHVAIPVGYRAAFSIEEQPAGLTRHLSVSVDRAGKMPSPEALSMIADEFGFTRFDMTWTEEFEPGQYAANVVEVFAPSQSGRA